MSSHVRRVLLSLLLTLASLCAAACGDDTSRAIPTEDAQADTQTPDTNPPPDTDTVPDTTLPNADAFDEADAAEPDAEDTSDTEDTSDAEDTPDVEDVPQGPPTASILRLNEVQCAGSEWIELLHPDPDPSPKSLEGWFLTDQPGDPARYYALQGTIEPLAFAVFSERTDANPTGYGFKLDCDTETLFLLDANHQVQDSVRLTPQAPFTYGRLPDADGPWIATEPTQGAPNQAAIDPLIDLFDPLLVHTVDLTITPQALDMLALFPREYAEASFRFTPAGSQTPTTSQTVGVRVKGRYGSFRTFDQKPALKLRFNWLPEGPDDFKGLRRLTLNNMVQDPSNLHEWAAYAIFRAVGVPAPRVGYVLVRVNDQPYGLYANIETQDALALARFFPTTAHLYEGSYGQDLRMEDLFSFEVDEGSDAIRSDLVALIQAVEAADPADFYAALDPLVNWDVTLTSFAVEQFIGHWDGYAPTSNNYYLHFSDSGEVTVLPWGTDQTFDDLRNVHEGYGVLFARCLQDPTCRDAYHAALQRVLDATRALDFPTILPAQVQAIFAHINDDPRREYGMDVVTYVQNRTLEFILLRLAELEPLLACYDTAQDPDNDGFVCDEDCRPDDPASYPGAFDTCGDLIDQNCNGWLDDDLSCPDCIELTVNTKPYWFCTRERTFPDARLQCQTLGAGVDLAIIDDATENDALWAQAQTLRSQNYWFGLDDNALEGSFVWSDGRTEAEVGFSAWAPGEPNNWGNNEHCAHFWPWEPSWNDIPCDYAMGSICELNPTP